jgi:hypothetical protein
MSRKSGYRFSDKDMREIKNPNPQFFVPALPIF